MSKSSFNLEDLDGYEFEELVASIMKKKGFKNVRVTKRSGDEGKDILMEDSEGILVVVECKNNKSVGRPVIQKLQGAMAHEQRKNQGKSVKGIVVTSGSFSKSASSYVEEINGVRLIDGRGLKNLCESLNILVLNGKIQVLTDASFGHFGNNQAASSSLGRYSKIYGSENHKPFVRASMVLKPACIVAFDVRFRTYTSVGCVDDYSGGGQFFLTGPQEKS